MSHSTCSFRVRAGLVVNLFGLLLLCTPSTLLAMGLPEFYVTEAYLMRPITQSSLVLAAGTASTTGYGAGYGEGDYAETPGFYYVGIAPTDWLEIGASTQFLGAEYSVDASVDLLAIFLNQSRVGVIASAGVFDRNINNDPEMRAVEVHDGGLLVWAPTDRLHLAIGAFSDSASLVPRLRLGFSWSLWRAVRPIVGLSVGFGSGYFTLTLSGSVVGTLRFGE